MILIGGQALRNLGSDRYTEDIDFLIMNKSSKETFIADAENKIDYINSANNSFFSEIYKMEEGRKEASPQALLELKAYAFVQHCQNFNFAKADACEYDIKFLVRNFDVSLKTVKKYVSSGELSEIVKIMNSVKK